MLSFGYWMFICRKIKGFQGSILFTILHKMTLFLLTDTTPNIAKGNVCNFLTILIWDVKIPKRNWYCHLYRVALRTLVLEYFLEVISTSA